MRRQRCRTNLAVARGRDVRIRYEVDTAKRITQWCWSGVGVVLETTDGPRQRTFQTSPHRQQNTLL